MKLELVRDFFSSTFTEGTLYIDGEPFCGTLEPCVGDNKTAFGKGCCIPLGTYAIDFHYSPKFRKYMLTLCGVKGRSGILIHSGNTHYDTAGCILVGEPYHVGHLSNSRSTLCDLFDKCLSASNSQSITITIKNK